MASATPVPPQTSGQQPSAPEQPAQQPAAGQLDNKRPKLKPNIGASIGLVDDDDKILLRQRTKGEKASITGKDYTSQWELPGGAADPVGDKKTDYWYVFREAVRLLRKETGYIIEDEVMLSCPGLPLFFDSPAGPDLAIVYPLPAARIANGFEEEVTDTDGLRWVNFDQLQEMARNGEILGGYGKCQHIMALHVLRDRASNEYVKDAAGEVLGKLELS